MVKDREAWCTAVLEVSHNIGCEKFGEDPELQAGILKYYPVIFWELLDIFGKRKGNGAMCKMGWSGDGIRCGDIC